MKLYAPEYYKNFKCIADKCRHSCCIGWEIDIDNKTAEKYAKLCGGYGETIKNSIAFDEVPHFILSDNDRCPHLNPEGLCNIILQNGEDHLCDICREHPRFYHDTIRGKEMGIGMACEEACRLILSSNGYDVFAEIGNADEPEDFHKTDFDAVLYRDKIYGILTDNQLSFSEKMQSVSSKFDVSAKTKSDEEWRNFFDSLEYLDESHRSLFFSYSSTLLNANKETEKQLERAFAYFVFRHCSPAFDEDDFKSSLGFACVCVNLIYSVSIANPRLGISEIARIVSEELEYSEENTQAIKFEFLF